MPGPERCPDCGAEHVGGSCPNCVSPPTVPPHMKADDLTFAQAEPGPTEPATPGPTEPATGLEGMGESVLPTLAALGPLPTVDLRESASAPPPPSGQSRGSSGTRYDLLGEIARGGMGAVIRGRDNDLGRDLAVKVLLEHHRDRPDLLHRFVEEAQIGGQLQHPGVVPVYELGTFPDSRPYFTMKLVRGRTLSALLTERESLSSDLPRFLAVFEQVCQTLAYAHARGVIHRDLKPANIMVGHFGEVQVMDWGLAKVLGRAEAPAAPAEAAPARPEGQVRTARSHDTRFSELSEPGAAMGTPAYMAPEQARGDMEQLDERADVFGLGAVLCQILTGRPAFVGKNQAETTLKAASADLADAHARLDACPADPEVVALARRCLAADRADRPRDAEEVARAMRAHLDGVQERLKQAEIERVEAEARASGERKRRRLQAGLGLSVLALTVVGGLSLASWRQQQQARASRVALALNEVELLRNQAAESADDVDLWDRAERAVRRAGLDLADVGGPAAARLAALQREISEAYQAARRDAVLLDELAEIRTSKEDLGLEGADHRYEQAFRAAGVDVLGTAPAAGGELLVTEPAAAAEPLRSRPARVVVAAAAGLDDWALVRNAFGMNPLQWRRPLEVARRVDPEPFRDRLRAALLDPDDKAGARSLRALAADPKAAELPPASAVLLAQFLRVSGANEPAVGVLRLAVAAHPEDVWVNYVLASTLLDLRPARREEAVQYYTAARAVRPETAHELAHLLQSMGRGDEATAVFTDLTRRRPDNPRHLACLGEHLLDHGRRAEGLEVLRRAEQAARAGLNDRANDTFLLNNLGNGLRVRGDAADAAEVFRRLVRLRPDYALAHRNLGLTLYDLRDYKGAAAEARQAIRLNPKEAAGYNQLGNALIEMGQVDEGIAVLRQAIGLLPEFSEAYTTLAYALLKKGQTAAGLETARRAVALRPDLDMARVNLGYALYRRGDNPAALAEYREAVRLNPYLEIAHTNTVSLLRELGRFDEAVAAGREAVRRLPDSANVHNSLGWALHARKDWPAAEAEYRTALRLDTSHLNARLNLVNLFLDRNEIGGAVATAREAVRVLPGSPEVQTSLGYALYREGDLDAAIACYREALRLNSDHTQASVNLVIALNEKKDPAAAALAAARLAARRAPGDFDAQLALGKALWTTDETAGAAAAFEAAVKLRPDSVEAWKGLGEARGGNDEPRAAADAFREAVRLAPDDADAWCDLGTQLAAALVLNDALAALREATRLQPRLARAHAMTGLVLAEQKDVAGALEALRAAVAADPTYAEAHTYLGMVHSARYDHEAAAAEYREAVRLGDTSEAAALNLAVSLAELNDFDGALEAVRLGIRNQPDSALAHGALAWLLSEHPDPRRKDLAGARREARRAVALDASNGPCQSNLALVELRSGNLEAARRACEAAVKIQGENPSDGFLLALIRHGEGHPAEARAAFEAAAALLRKEPIPDSDVLALQSEAAAALGLTDPVPREFPDHPLQN